MIVSFGSKDTERIWNGEPVKKIPIEIQQIGRRKLRMINNSQNWSDLRIPPSNRLENCKVQIFIVSGSMINGELYLGGLIIMQPLLR